MILQRDEILETLGYMIPFYPALTVTKPMIDAYIEALADVNVVGLRAAAVELCNSGKYFPTVTEIKQTAARTLAVANLAGWQESLCEVRNRRQSLRQAVFAGEVDQEAIESLYRRAWSLGAWDVAKNIRLLAECE